MSQTIDRRRFLKGAGAALAGTALGGLAGLGVNLALIALVKQEVIRAALDRGWESITPRQVRLRLARRGRVPMTLGFNAQPAAFLPPAEFSSQYLRSMDASEGRRKRRKRDTTPDAIDMTLKRDLLEAAIDSAPTAADFETWLMAQALSVPASGPRLAMAAEILADYQMACLDPGYCGWLAQGAPSADADVDNNP